MEFDIHDLITFSEEETLDFKTPLIPGTNDGDFDQDSDDSKSSSDGADDLSNDQSSQDDKKDGTKTPKEKDANQDFFLEEEEKEEEAEEETKSIDINEFFNTLKSSNYLQLPEEFEFDGSTDKLAEAIDLTYDKFKDQARESLLNSLDPESQLALKYALVNKKPLYSFYEENDFSSVDYSSLDLDDEDNQANIVRDYLRKTTALNDVKIENQVKLFAKTGELASEAKDYLGELIAMQTAEQQELEEKLKQQEIKAKEDTLKWKQDRLQVIQSTPQLEETRKNKLKAFVLNEVYTDRSKAPITELMMVIGQINKNPEHYVQLADILMDYSPEKGIDLERLKLKLNTKAATTLKDKLDSVPSVPKGSKQFKNKIEEDFNWDEWAKHL